MVGAPLKARLAAAAAAFGLVAAPSYAIQRLIDGLNEPPIGTILAQAHIPYYWRVGIAVLHGISAALIVSFLLHRDGQAERFLNRLPPWLLGVVVISAIAMGLRP